MSDDDKRPTTWAEYEKAQRALQAFSPKFSRAELCRRAGISDATMFKGIRKGTSPRGHTGGPVKREILAEAARLPLDLRQKLDLILEAEGVMIEAGLRDEEIAEAAE